MHLNGTILLAGRVEHLTGDFDRLADDGRRAGAGGVFEAKGVEGHSALQDVLENLRIELRSMRLGVHVWRQAHHGDGGLVLQACVVYAGAAVADVADVVQGVEVPYCRHAVFLEHLGM